MRRFIFWNFWLVLSLTGLVCAAENEHADGGILFQIGIPDGQRDEFGNTVRSEDFFDSDQPLCRYVVGKNRSRDWIPMMCSTRDWHNAGHVFRVEIEYSADRDFPEPLYFAIGFCYGHTSEPSLLHLKVNGTELTPQRVPKGPAGHPPFPAGMFGWPTNMVIPIPAGLVKQGKNILEFKLTDGSWAFFDYLALRTKNEPLEVKKREGMLQKFRAPGGPMESVHEVLFATGQPSYDSHWYANFGYYACDTEEFPFPLGSGGSLRILNLDSGQARVLLEDKKGNIRDPQVHYDGKKAIFSYLKAGSRHYHLYEINLDGSGLRQLTFGDWDDIEPAYLPDGDIVFSSSRCKRWVQCWLTGVATLHRCGPNGEDIRPISCNPEQENTPWVLPDGRILYMRWEYIDRSQVHYHHLWTVRPDGTQHAAYYGNQHPVTPASTSTMCLLDGKPVAYRADVPPEKQTYPVVCTFSRWHGIRGHYGMITLVDPKNGPDDLEGIRHISVGYDHADPWAFSEDAFLVAKYSELCVMNGEGIDVPIYALTPEEKEAKVWISDPQPLITRQREAILADGTDPKRTTGRIAMANIYAGPHLKNMPKGTVKELLVMEPLPIPIHYNGGMMLISSGGTFCLTRIVGTIPVHEDGSAYMELPAKRTFFFIAMDQAGRAIKRMHSFTSLMPGEDASCVGCHELRTETPSADDPMQLMKVLAREPDKPKPIEGIPEIFDFLRDIRPILDKHCLECHNDERMDGGFNASSDIRPNGFAVSYLHLGDRNMFGDNRNRPESDFAPYQIGSCASQLAQLLASGHPDEKGNPRCHVSETEQRLVHYWLEAGANFAGTYAANGSGSILWSYTPFNHERNVDYTHPIREDTNWPETQAMTEALTRRCGGCHGAADAQRKAPSLPKTLSASTGGAYSPTLLFNLSFPERSKILCAPLAKTADGWERCGEPVFQNTDDADYQAILAGIRRGHRFITVERTHFGYVPSIPFVPNPWYTREMKRFGVLPPDYQDGTPIDPYATDERYWRMLAE